jgi:hypothetical protein
MRPDGTTRQITNTRSCSEACAASAGARLRVGAHMNVSAVSAESVDGTLPEKRFSLRYLCHNGLLRTPETAGRPHGGGSGAYRSTSLVSAVMLARIGPVKPFLPKPLITRGEACGRTRRTANAKPHARSEACAASAGARLRVGAHMYVSAVSATIVDGKLPEKRFSLRYLYHNGLLRTPESAGRPHGGGRRVQVDQPGKRSDARQDRAGEAVLGQVPDHAR